MTDTRDADTPRVRLSGVDAARSVALIGMVATHLLPLERDGGPTVVALLFDGRASALFAVLAGVGIALGTGGPDRPSRSGEHGRAAAGLVVRAVLVGVLGLVVATLEPPPLVILPYYGLLFLVAVPLLGLPARVLGAGALVWCVASPVISQAVRDGPRAPEQVGLLDLAHPVAMAAALVVTGVYPVLTWTTYLLAGMAAGRADLRRPRTAWALFVGGAVLSAAASVLSHVLLEHGGTAAIGELALAEARYGTTPTSTWWWLAVDLPHSGTPLDLARTTGSAFAVLGLSLLLARWLPRGILWLPAAIGAAPLTLYVVHVLLTTLGSDGGLPLFLLHVVVLATIGAVVARRGGRGPLESVVSRASGWGRTLPDRWGRGS